MVRIFNPRKPDITLALKAQEFRVEPMPRITPQTRWRTEAMRSYAQPMLLWFTRGQGRITVSGVTHGFGPHHAIFLPAGTMHGYEMLGQAFGTSLFFPRQNDLGLPQTALHLRFREAPQQAELNALIDNIQRELKLEQPQQARALNAHAELLTVWLNRATDENTLHDFRADAARRLAMAYTGLVEREYRTGKTVQDYAALLGVTPTHLTRSCKQACGRSASAILAERLHFEARNLLTGTRRPVKDIAASLGFRSAAYFTRAFQKHTGHAPSEFRRRGRP